MMDWKDTKAAERATLAFLNSLDQSKRISFSKLRLTDMGDGRHAVEVPQDGVTALANFSVGTLRDFDKRLYNNASHANKTRRAKAESGGMPHARTRTCTQTACSLVWEMVHGSMCTYRLANFLRCLQRPPLSSSIRGLLR